MTDLLGQPLQPERSFNYSVRLHWPMAENKTFSATAYRINIQDRIVLGSQLDGRDHSMLYDLLETNDLDKVQFFSNSIETATWGLDLGYEQQWSVGVNDELRLRLVGSINRTRLSGIKLPASLQGLEHVVFNRQDQARLEYAQPQSKAIAQLSWFHQQLSVNLQSTRFGRVTYRHPADGQSDNWIYNGYTGTVETRDQTFSPKWITDLALQWQVRKHLRYGLQIRNVFDVYPDEHRHSANTNDGTFRYSRYVQQFGVWGQHFLISCQFSW
ncbi:MAG: TonB-dependent receptor [Bacteroidota bacterium]